MKRASFHLGLTTVLIATFLLLGCYDENPVSDDEFLDFSDYPTILEVTPEDGATGIDRYSSFTIRFSDGMDTSSVISNCYLSGGTGLRQWMDSASHHGGTGGMHGGADSLHDRMMDWMDSTSCTGRFDWNHDYDICTFYPDSAMHANTEYMIYITGDVRSHDNYRMQMDSLQLDGFIFSFTTGQ